ncbi:MAG: AAA family ATPase, partial [Verrucomicrobia bacterium]|nr:AAA family ATPase [Verrucomicrobiota bacterium]
ILSQRAVLERLEARREGYAEGVAEALERWRETAGVLADHLKVSPKHLRAVEAVLGRGLQIILARDPATARQIAQTLAQEEKGWAAASSSELPLLRAGDRRGLTPGQAAAALQQWDHAPLLDLVECPESLRPLLASLLGEVCLVPDLETAQAAWLASGGRYAFVTPRGELLTREGVFAGGVRRGRTGDDFSLLERKNELARLSARAAELQEALQARSREREQIERRDAELAKRIREEERGAVKLETTLAALKEQAAATRRSLEQAARQKEEAAFEWKAAEEEARQAEEEIKAARAGLEQVLAQEAECREKRKRLSAESQTLKERRDALRRELSEAKAALAASREALVAQRNRADPLRKRAEELERLARDREKRAEGWRRQAAQIERELESLAAKIETFQRQAEEKEKELAALEETRRAAAARAAAAGEEIDALRAKAAAAQKEAAEREVRLAELRMTLRNLVEHIREKYGREPGDYPLEAVRLTRASNGALEVETFPAEEAALGTPMEEAASDAEAEKAARELQQRLHQLGAVNLVAIEEYEETEQRLRFLQDQYDDLVEARKRLTALINRINVQTREMFLETFEKVRVNFRALFSEIFGGGKADLRLLDAEDALESGVEIVARPPGKQLQSIRLLSGGEQTMTAVALLFAIYQVRPSPFCVLDELDAPLDESNIDRFLRILRRFLRHSQFIVITHNKRTLAMADVLYGVTMEERGVSKILSAKFKSAGGEEREPVPALSGEPDGEVSVG